MGDHLAIIDLEAVSMGESRPDGLRLFAGYSGWGPGQLDSELLAGAWIVVEGFDGDVLGPRPERLWREVLRRQGGATARLALYPESPMMN
jgi:putative transcriptional regulator